MPETRFTSFLALSVYLRVVLLGLHRNPVLNSIFSHWMASGFMLLKELAFGTRSTFYNRTSEARKLMARLPRLFRTRSYVPRKNPIAADLG